MKPIGWLLAILVLPASVGAGPLVPFDSVPVPGRESDSPALVELGKQLFFDRRLSGDGTMSCGTCHDPDMGFSDGLDISLNYPTTRNWRNSPTLINTALQKSLFHDGRAATLEEQALFPMMSAFEMNQNLDYLEEEIRAVSEYEAAFADAFGDPDVTRERIAKAIAAFERTLISRDAPLDRFLAGDERALSPEAQQGYQLFVGKGNCSQCHFGPNLMDDRFHALMVPENPEHLTDPRITATRRFVAKLYGFEDFRTLDEDPGRYLITKDEKDWKAFKTPTLRDVAKTAPYMHNGVFATLDQVIDFFAAGGGENNRVLQPVPLDAQERQQLRSFLEEGLTGAEIVIDYPKIP